MSDVAFTTLELRRGDTGKWTVPIVDLDGVALDITGCSFRMAFFAGVNAPASSVTSDTSASLTLSSPSSGIVLTATSPGTITITMSKTQSAALTYEVYSFDLQMTNPSAEEYTCAAGILLLTDQITHAT